MTRKVLRNWVQGIVSRKAELAKRNPYKTGAEELTLAQRAKFNRFKTAEKKLSDEIQGKISKLPPTEQTYVRLYAAALENLGNTADIDISDADIRTAMQDQPNIRGKTTNLVPLPLPYLQKHSFDNIDSSIRGLIADLVNNKFTTVASCSGHGRSVGGYVNFEVGSLTPSRKRQAEQIFRRHGITSIRWSSLSDDPIQARFPSNNTRTLTNKTQHRPSNRKHNTPTSIGGIR